MGDNHPNEADSLPQLPPSPAALQRQPAAIVTMKEEDVQDIRDIPDFDSAHVDEKTGGNGLVYDVYLRLVDAAARHVSEPVQERFRLLFILSITPALLTFASFAACLVAAATVVAGLFTLFWFGVAFVAFWLGGALYAFLFALGLTLLTATILLAATLVGGLFVATAVARATWRRVFGAGGPLAVEAADLDSLNGDDGAAEIGPAEGIGEHKDGGHVVGGERVDGGAVVPIIQ